MPDCENVLRIERTLLAYGQFPCRFSSEYGDTAILWWLAASVRVVVAVLVTSRRSAKNAGGGLGEPGAEKVSEGWFFAVTRKKLKGSKLCWTPNQGFRKLNVGLNLVPLLG